MLLGSAVAVASLGLRPAAAAPPQPDNIQTAAAQGLTVGVAIANKGPYRFLVDTGADRTVIAQEVAAELGLADAGKVIVQGITSAAPAPTARLPSLAFGPVTLSSMTAPVLPRAALGADGYLGLDAIDGRRVVFDFANRRLAVTDGAPAWLDRMQRPGDILVPADGRAGRLASVHCAVEGVPAAAFIDSGAEISVGNSHLFAALGKSYISEQPIVLTGVTGGTALGRLASIDTMRLGGLAFTGGVLVISDLPIFALWGLADRPALFIGMNYLRRTASLAIDYRRKELLFRVAETRIASRA